MKRISCLMMLALGVVMAGCGGSGKTEGVSENPFLQPFTTKYGVPPFDEIKMEFYEPAVRELMGRQDQEIKSIVDNPDTATFENTVVALSYSGKDLDRVSAVFFNLIEAIASPEMQALAEKLSPLFSEHEDNILLNDKLFARVKRVYEQREALGLRGEDRRLVEETYKRFVRAGANLNDEDKGTLREINLALSKASLKFGQNLLAETNGMELLLSDSSQLAGLPDGVRAAAAQSAREAGKAGWRFTPHKPSLLPFLTYCESPELRAELYKTYYTRGDRGNEFDNKELVRTIVNLRLQKAKLLGFSSYADYVLDNRMAKTPEAAMEVLNALWVNALASAKNERKELERAMRAEGRQTALSAADWWYYTEKVRKEKYDIDEEMLRPYLSIDSVRNGVFELARRLYGITFRRDTALPVYQKDVEAYEVLNEDGSHLAVIYFDFYPRAGKSAGAWCTTFQAQYTRLTGENVAPVVSIVCNFTPPAADQPALLSFDETETLFHEFGHALHAFFSKIKYPSLGDVPRDFVEMPSQLMEHWASHPQFLRVYAHHYKTGEAMPEELINKLTASKHFNNGFTATELTAASLLDMYYHMRQEPLTDDVDLFEKTRMEEIGLIPEILPRYRSTYFSHIFDGGYAAGYYGYSWSEMLDADVFQAFVERGDIFSREVAGAFREKILQNGGTKDALEMFKDFRGRGPKIDALLENRGFTKGKQEK